MAGLCMRGNDFCRPPMLSPAHLKTKNTEDKRGAEPFSIRKRVRHLRNATSKLLCQPKRSQPMRVTGPRTPKRSEPSWRQQEHGGAWRAFFFSNNDELLWFIRVHLGSFQDFCTEIVTSSPAGVNTSTD
eukprot:3789508-Rhodomonas_salina.1